MDSAAEAWFKRRIEALEDIANFVSHFGLQHGLSDEALFHLQLAIEEVFTNMLKYESDADTDIRISLQAAPAEVKATITGYGVEPFDITQAPAVDFAEAARHHSVGGRGIELVRKLMDGLHYDYADGISTLTMRKARK